jgi:hypothetical protein
VGSPLAGGRYVLSGGQSGLYEGHIYFEPNMEEKLNIYFGRHFAWLKSEACFITYLHLNKVFINSQKYVIH